jgi:hypothetical protein
VRGEKKEKRRERKAKTEEFGPAETEGVARNWGRKPSGKGPGEDLRKGQENEDKCPLALGRIIV